MKKILYIPLILLALFSCQNTKKDNQTTQNENNTLSANNTVEVLYFHGKQRCPTCQAIENQTLQLLDSAYSEQLSDKKIVFRVIDISEKKNQSVAEKYQVTWSSLFVNFINAEGKESAENLTDFAFNYARNNPDLFKSELKEVIDEHLNTQQ